MTGRMESVENLVRQRERFAPQRQIFHPSHRPLEIAGAIPTFPQPDDDSLLQTYKPQNQGDTSTGLTQGTFLLGLDIGWRNGCASPGEGVDSCRQRSQIGNPGLDGIFSFSILPLRMASFAGLGALSVACCYLLYALYARFVLNESPAGFTALIFFIVFLSGVQMLFLGLIGEYLGRIYEETKRRLLYIVSRIVG